ncbi:MAG: cytochrome c biogenesis protein ResB [Elusimicrobia bacterium]|nr:cytochrome c biogenesis protein ResB [Elusimicrobiota bacterium]
MKLLDTLSSIRLFYTCASLLLVGCVLGGVIPQNAPPEKYLEMFGHVFGGAVMRFGLADVFRSYWFMGLLAFSALNLLACSIRRWKSVKVRPGVFIAHVAVLFIFAGGIVRGGFSQHGFLPLEAGTSSETFTLNNGRTAPLPFSIHLRDFSIDYWQPELHRLHVQRISDGLHESQDVALDGAVKFNPIGITVKAVKFFPNFIMGDDGPASRDEARENPALELLVNEGGVERRQFVFANFPDFHQTPQNASSRIFYEYVPGRVKQFNSRLAIFENGKEVMEKTIHVNNPMTYKGFRFFQAGFDPKNIRFSSLQVSKDPSVPLIYLGFGLLLVGLAWAFLKRPGRV